ncbi:uncharacterized protein LOC100644222 isoform X1 [Bombus terrestris]|uniref:Uncharacterized protein LOC100644222 isoform X1 n=1 Tax=Bombus terrestris TaxID=30195 RepID=A0A6P3U858_BOMTE|nr:uncharacterized protein LOC100644222 isoform X1 [Bombus terrestris]XP_012170627.2 uncharacterized protein LOC100644222 isoform X1 [Bombus terrestris]XP_012170628.2 uncharacterized protein LOC100644222 isoform X1 [Bombus terrestris]XP_012170629.2 uncharacterized protein LOC100644222 isoform X1 [Bombus terrestris]XP_012170630.2 uncharacterized protein LOC100644222 isoform X1 [Bombus terrestris]XP_020721578.2 uncharacterized protein LOC100644222 isoform X1 [Bombus terrestris]XP_048266612.1 un
MSNSLDSFLTRIGDVTIERVTPRPGPKPNETIMSNETVTNTNMNNIEPQTGNDESSEESSGETSDGEHDKKNDTLQSEEIEEIRSEGSGDDMDLDETIDSQIGVRAESERQHHSQAEEDDEEPVNILDTLPLEGAPIEGQEVSEADLLGKPISKDTDDEGSIGHENDKHEGHAMEEEGTESNKRHADSEHSDTAKKKQKKDDGTEGSASECETKAEKKLANMRRNIREVMDETQLDEATLSAQRQEMERLRRVQEQQRLIREVQRHMAITRQTMKAKTRVISLLQGKQNQAGTTISQSSPSGPVRLPNTVFFKVSSGSGTGSQTTSGIQTNQIQKRSVESSRWQKGRGIYQGAQTSISRIANRPSGPNMLQQRIRMMTPSVSISPVVPKKEPMDRSEYYSDSEISDIEAEETLREKQIHAAKKISTGPKSQKTAKGKDVVTISSSSESSDDDCIVLSDPSGEEETDNEDDPSNSGMHTNDRYNIPDEHGRVLINVGHPETEPNVFLAPQVARIIKPHQIGGIRFLYDNIVESIERFKTSSGFGCILAHSMGLGKTLQVASFCDIFFRCTTSKTVLCIMPINTLQNWLAEFNMWLPYEDPNAPEKYSKSSGIKSESVIELKQEVKDESGNQSDMSNMSSMSNISRPISTESAHRFGQENTSQPMNIVPENPYIHPGYETHNMMPGYVQDNMLNKNISNSQVHINENYHGDISQNALYNTNPNPMSTFESIKSEVNCHGQQRSNMSDTKFGMENQNSNNIYSGLENRPQAPIYPGIETRNPTSLYHGVESHHSGSIYSNFDNSTNTFSNYINRSTQESDQESRKDCFKNTLSSMNAEVNVKKEPEEIVKKEESTCTTKEEISNEEKKEIEKVKTPFSVDSPIGMEMRPRHFRLHILNDSHKTMTARAKVIQDWQVGGGVLLIGYELYRQLSLKKPNKAKRKRGQPFKDTVDVEEEDKNKGLLDEMHTALVNPGPDLVICDEGHRIKNSHASISMALKQMRTKRRIVLTGYPLQNNLLEYWCMVDFVRPNYLGTKSEFCNMFERPIQNGQCIDSTPQDIRLMRYRAHVLHALLEGFVQRRSHSVLQVSLPRKEEYILLVRMTSHQRKLYDTFMNQVVKTRAVPNPLKAFAVCCKIWNHPDILYHFLRKRQANEEDDLDLEETIGEKSTPGGKRSKARQPKGESKKGKKTNTTIKNKPAASVQPNSSSSSNTDNVENDNSHTTPKQNNYSNYPPMPMNNSGYSNSISQNSYPHGYQNYRSNDQNTYYRNENSHGEYNEFYNNQGSQRYGNQSFQTYSQTPGYNAPQNYPNQSQNYIPNSEQSTNNHSQRYSTATSNSEFRSDQNQGNNYEVSGMFPRQSYPYQDHGRNYGSTINQGSNNYSQVPNQSSFQSQMPNQSANMPLPDYSSYTPNQTQNYNPAAGQTNTIYSRNEGQPLQNSTLGYDTNQQSQNSSSQTPTAAYLANQQGQNTTSGQNRGFSPNQQNQNLPLQSSSHTYGGSQSQNIPISNQPHNYPTQVNPNPSPQTSLNFSQQSPNTMPQNQPHPYMTNSSNQTSIPQNQMRGYSTAAQNQMNVPQNSSSYPTGQSASNPTQTHGYAQDQQGSVSNAQGTMHGYSHLVSPSTPQNQSYPPNMQSQTGTPSNANHAYGSNHQGPTSIPSTPTHRYSSSQQGQISQSQNQALPYSQNQQTQSSINQSDQLYSRPDNQQQTQTYTPTANTSHEFSTDRQSGSSSTNPTNNYSINQTSSQNTVVPNYSTDGAHSNQVSQMKSSEDPYWQRNYSQPFQSDQCNDPYYRDVNPNVNRYQSNYFPSQNYQNQSYDYSNNHNSDINTRSEDSKPQQTTTHIQSSGSSEKNKNNKEMTSSVGVQSQPIHQNSSSSTSSGYGSESNCQTSVSRSVQNLNSLHSPRLNQNDLVKEDEKEKEDLLDKDKEEKSDDEILTKDEEKDCKSSPGGKEDPGIPYDWATELMKGYVPGLMDASAKMTIFFCILEEAIKLGDRVLAFSQSLFTLNLIEDFLARNSLKYPDGQTDAWIKNVNYYRLDGSTSALEREKLINEFNNNPKIHLFLVSTRAGSLGINLVGANRAIVFDASWNPCHDTQAVCRVYRYGQQKPCFVYRLVTDNCLERKIYDRQISKQGMADRVVDQCNPDAHLSLKEATTLSWDWEEDSQVQDFSQTKDSYSDEVMHRVLERHSSLLTKQPFHHESLLVDRKDKKLSQAEKRLARRGYELEKMAANCSRPSYNYVPGNTATRAGGLQIRAIRGGDSSTTSKPVASVRPMQQRGAEGIGSRSVTGSRWIPAEVWQRQGMSAQEMTLPLDVVIPTNSPDKGSIVLKAGQRVMVLKSPKGIYMQLESGKIIAIRTALKLNQQKREEEPKKGVSSMAQRNSKPEVGFPLRNNSAISIIPKSSSSNQASGRSINKPGNGPNYRPFADKETLKRPKPVVTATAKPYLSQVNLTNQVSLSRLPKIKQEPVDHSTLGENSNSSDGQVRTEQRVEEVRLEDVVAEVSSNTDYNPNHNRATSSDTDIALQKSSEENSQVYTSDSVTAQSVQTQHDQTETELTSKIDKQCSPSIEKEIIKTTDTLTNYGHAFQTQQEKRDASNDEIIIEDPSPIPPQIQSQVPSQMQSQMPLQVSPQVQSQVLPQIPPQLPTQIQPQVPSQLSSQGPSQIPQASPQVAPQVATQVATQPTSSGSLPPLLTQQSTSSTMQVPSATPTLRATEVPKGITDSTIGSSATSICTGTNTITSPKTAEPSMRETCIQSEPLNVPQGYPYAQYPRYYDYNDPRSRSLSTPYGTYFPGVPPHAANPRLPMDTSKSQPDVGKPIEERAMMNVPPAYSQVSNTTAKTSANTIETKGAEAMVTTTVATTPTRDETHIPTAFSHPTSSRYPGPYPPGPYDPYSQHYPPAPGSSATYPPGVAAPGYPAYGGPSYNTEYARMYTAFHGPPPPADPYIHRGYAPPSSHPPNYYPPFPHPPPPYPNYSFLSPYPNPNMPSEPQPPAQ